MNTDARPLIEINQQAISLLYKELGVVDAVRFLKQFTQGYGNYTQEREVIFANKSLDDVVNEIEKRRKTSQKKVRERRRLIIAWSKTPNGDDIRILPGPPFEFLPRYS